MMVNARHCRFIVNEALSDEEIARIYLIKACTGRPAQRMLLLRPYLASFSAAVSQQETLRQK